MVHWHGLCCRKDQQPHVLLDEVIKQGLLDDDCVLTFSNWAETQFKMTASHRAGKNQNGKPRQNMWPAPRRICT